MTTVQITAKNIKCGGCAATIKGNLLQIAGVTAVEVDIGAGRVEVQGEALSRQDLVRRLAELGYPEA
ncbi:MAG: heavy-metal-associated domain-containing protein [Gammaproteobacteria bacterium]|nr:heavy-metal-associated domain-containing protein [Gammaproteobacteria bacterium]